MVGLATVRDETELIGKGLDLLGKVIEKKPEGKAPEEEADPNQAVEIEPAHDHEDHFEWYHEHMIGLWIAIVMVIGSIVVALLKLKGRPARRRARRLTRK